MKKLLGGLVLLLLAGLAPGLWRAARGNGAYLALNRALAAADAVALRAAEARFAGAAANAAADGSRR
ncbi:MAG: hypothetical protein KC425_26810, partial [Anaerolineales bacterium]|nr:hypothetical protein [Anaerolineales bacterium]